jgi:hypothetical protein
LPEATHSVSRQYDVNDLNAPRMRDMVLDGPALWDPSMTRPPEYYVYLYTISKREFTVYRAPLIRSLIIPACGPTERYRLVTRLSQPFPQPDTDPKNGDVIVHDRGKSHDARYIAQDICNPDNMTLDQNAYVGMNDRLVSGYGTNLSAQGVFWSLSNPPAEEEIKAAERRREIYYGKLWEQANMLAAADPKALAVALTQDHHMAAEYFGREASWHQILRPMADCPNCGEKIKPGIAFHKNQELGIICVIDPGRARAAGVLVGTATVSKEEPVTEAPVKRGPGRPRKETPTEELARFKREVSEI